MRKLLFIALALVMPLYAQAASKRAAQAANLADLPIVFDAQRILLDIEIMRPDGSPRKTRVWFNMGMAAPVLSRALYRELEIDRGRPLVAQLGKVTIETPAANIVDGDGKNIGDPEFAQLFAPHAVEAMLPAKLFLDYVVMLDYPARRFKLSQGEAAPRDGTPTPFDLNPQTGLIVVDTRIDDASWPFVIDAGAGYSWARGDVVRQWTRAHPDWRRTDGAVGLANNAMLDFDFEKKGTLARVPQIAIGGLSLRDVGVLGTGPILGTFGDALIGDFFWDNWQKSAPRPISGWLGGNALASYRLTIDYPNRMSYWRGAATSGAHDVDQVGVTLVRRDGRFFVGGIVKRASVNDDADTVSGVTTGDKLVMVDGSPIQGASKDDVLARLRGAAGAPRLLTVERDGQRLNVETYVTNFN